MRTRGRRYTLINGIGGFGGGPSFPAVALFRQGGAWLVVDDNHQRPDGYFVEQGGALVIDENATTGLTISVDGLLIVGT